MTNSRRAISVKGLTTYLTTLGYTRRKWYNLRSITGLNAGLWGGMPNFVDTGLGDSLDLDSALLRRSIRPPLPNVLGTDGVAESFGDEFRPAPMK